jgi:2-oxoglutarate ferredoxin oxidoreductase subunit delta
MTRRKLKEHRIDTEWCKGCGICIALCPKSVLALNDKDKVIVLSSEKCIACMLCELRCPDLAIEVITEEEARQRVRYHVRSC